MVQLPSEAQRMLNSMWLEMEASRQEGIRERARANPKAHKLSTVMPKGARLNYRVYPAGKDGRGNRVDFCVSEHVNCAGYILGWREIRYRKPRRKTRVVMERKNWTAYKSLGTAIKRAQQKAETFKTKHS
jgi:hypothetical protein